MFSCHLSKDFHKRGDQSVYVALVVSTGCFQYHQCTKQLTRGTVSRSAI